MDFLDPNKKRARNIRLFIGYILVAVAIAVGSLVLLLLAYGYDIDRQTGQVIQNGLIFVSSQPESADVYLNGALKDRTNAKLVVQAGQYNVELKKAGYNTWQRSVSLEGGSIEQLVYPVLFPQKPVTKDVQLYANLPIFASQSPDRRWLVVQQSGPITNFDSIDLNDSAKEPTKLALPSGVMTEAPGNHSLALVEWSTDNKHLLVKHSFAAATEFIIIDRETPANSLNLNKTLSTNPTAISLRDKHYDQFYVYDSKTKVLQVANVKDKTLSTLLTGVIAYKSYGADTVLYVTDDNQAPAKNAIKLWDGSQNYPVHYYPTSVDYILDIASFNGHIYFIIAQKNSNEVYIYKDTLKKIKKDSAVLPPPAIMLKMDKLSFVSFSTIARFIVAQSGAHFAVYDAETNRRYYYDLKDTVSPDLKATWMDGHRLVLVNNGKTTVFDFDGINKQTLASSTAGFNPYFSSDYLGLYNIAPSVQVPGRFSLTRTELKVSK